jgi:hypothetical protein
MKKYFNKNVDNPVDNNMDKFRPPQDIRSIRKMPKECAVTAPWYESEQNTQFGGYTSFNKFSIK